MCHMEFISSFNKSQWTGSGVIFDNQNVTKCILNQGGRQMQWEFILNEYFNVIFVFCRVRIFFVLLVRLVGY